MSISEKPPFVLVIHITHYLNQHRSLDRYNVIRYRKTTGDNLFDNE